MGKKSISIDSTVHTNKQVFTSTLKSLAHSSHLCKVFSDVLEILSLACHQIPYHNSQLPKDNIYEQIEEQYLKRISDYSKEDAHTIAKLMGILAVEYQQNRFKRDFLGELYSGLDCCDDDLGQFFTPWDLSKVTSEVIMDNEEIKQKINDKGFIKILDPACGSGGMLLSGASKMQTLGYEPEFFGFFCGTDLDRDCFNMSYIQVSLSNLNAVIDWGNALTQEVKESRPTPFRRLYLFHQHYLMSKS